MSGTTDLVDFDGTAYNSSGAQSYAGESITLSGADPEFITDGADVKFSDGNITLATASDLSVDTGSGNGDIIIAGKILGTDDGTATTVTLDAGSGDIDLSEEIGGTGNDDIGAVSLTGTTITDY